MQTPTLRGFYVALITALGVAGCAAAPPVAPRAAYSPDIPWLERLTFGVNSKVLAQYQKLGRGGFLDSQLQPTDERLPDPVAHEIARLSGAQIDAEHLFVGVALEQRRINAMPEG